MKPLQSATLTILAFACPGEALTQSAVSHAQAPLADAARLVQDPSVRIVENYVNPLYAVSRSMGAAAPGELQPRPSGDPQALSLSSCYDNTLSGSPYYDLAAGREIVDFGNKSCGSSNIVGKIGFGVRTTQLPVSQGGPGFRIGLRLYGSSTNGANPGALGPLVADYTIIGDGVPFAPAPAAYIQGELTLPTPVIIGDYNFFAGWTGFGWSYYWKENATDPLLAATAGGACATFFSPDPNTGTYDCLASYVYPSETGPYLGSSTPSPGLGSLYLELWEEDPFPATIAFRNAAPNVPSYSCNPIIIGGTWSPQVLVVQSGHTLGLVFGFDTPVSVALGGGQVVLVADGGSGELLGFAPRPGPLASWSLTVPFDLSLVGRYVGTQAIAYGAGAGVTTYSLTNAIDCTIGTF